ncbi:transcriptional regulator with XRE-family HTH domain [Bradyrhizobium embrapense]
MLTQAAFAERLGISLSYLNQIENNQRPVSASVLVLLAEKFQVDLSSLSLNDSDKVISMLAESLADPIFASYTPSIQELKLVVQNAPGFAQALLNAHQAYRRNSEQLASLDGQIANLAGEPTAYEEVRDFFHLVDNYVDELDTAAEALAGQLNIPDSNATSALISYLESKHGVQTRQSAPNETSLRQFDRASRTLFLSQYLPTPTRTFQIALQIAALEEEDRIGQIADKATFRSVDARNVCAAGLRNYFAGALVLPYQRFLQSARELRHDLELLATRFGASLEQVAHRLSTLQRQGSKGVCPFSSPDWTAPGTSPNATARQNCNLHATEPPARSGMRTRHSRPQAKSFGNSPRHRTAFDFFASQPNFRKAGAASALLVRAMPSRWDAKSPMQRISYMQTGSTSQAKAPSIRSEFLVESASGPIVLNARSRRSRAD